MDKLGIEFISVFGMPPVEYIELSASLGCRNVGLAPAPIVTLDGLYPEWTMRGNPALVRDVRQALKDNGVTVSVGEGFVIMPGIDLDAYQADFDLLAELGAQVTNACCVEADFAANVDGFGRLAEMAARRNLPITVEYLPGMVVGTLETACELIEQVGRPNAGLLIDSMHLFRSGASAADVAALPQGLVLYAQLCDVPVVSRFDDYSVEARFERLAPGDGELPLLDFVKALPGDLVIGLEVPMRCLSEQGVSAADRLTPALAKARALFEAAGV